MKPAHAGHALTESLWVALVLVIGLLLPLDDRGLPSADGNSALSRLADALRAHQAAWTYAHSLPDA